MAKKVTKRSRAARRGEIDLETPEVKSLENLPRSENTNVASSIIRTTAKNEDLLNQKLLKKQKKTQGVSKVTKEKKSRFDKVDGRFAAKLERSMERSKLVKAQRKLNWDSVNSRIRQELQKGTITEEDVQKKLEDKTAEELEFADFFEDESKEIKPPQNPFELLSEEVEA